MLLMPIRLPAASTSAPPELPRLIAASVWMKSSKRIDAEVVAPERAHDPRSHRVAEPERVADREHGVPDLHAVDRAEGDRRKALLLRLQHREVGIGVDAADTGRDAPSVVQHELDIVRALDHVVVREHETLGRHDDPRPEARHALERHALGEIREVAAHHRVVGERAPRPHFLARVDVDHRGHRLPRGVRVTRDRRRHHRSRRLLAQHDAGFARAAATEQVGTQRRDDEQRREAQRAGLREQEPELAQHRRIVRGAIRSIIVACCGASERMIDVAARRAGIRHESALFVARG